MFSNAGEFLKSKIIIQINYSFKLEIIYLNAHNLRMQIYNMG